MNFCWFLLVARLHGCTVDDISPQLRTKEWARLLDKGDLLRLRQGAAARSLLGAANAKGQMPSFSFHGNVATRQHECHERIYLVYLLDSDCVIDMFLYCYFLTWRFLPALCCENFRLFVQRCQDVIFTYLYQRDGFWRWLSVDASPSLNSVISLL